jgi:uncharacterized protein YjbI with pentapeptide repeats
VSDAASGKGRKAKMTDSKPPKWYDRTRYQVLLFVGGIALFVLAGAWILDWYINPQTPTQRKDLAQALGLLTAGVAGAVGIFFTWRGQRITQESLQDTRENTEENLRLTWQGQITERFTRAIEQLGATDDKGEKKLEIRLGGIYSLERIDKESPERAYHGTVMEVLTAYVRENSHWEPEEPSTSTTASNEGVEQEKGSEQHAEPTLRGLPTDIQAIIDVLNRREEERVPEEYRVRLDLKEAKLEGTNLIGANFREANFREANLQGAYLVEANLYDAYLQGAYLQGANLQGANLQGANLIGAYLREANLQEADLQGAYLIGAYLYGADLQEAYLVEANLQGANLQGADLQEAYLVEANLRGADLQRARNLTQNQIEWTIGSNETLLPADLNPPELWSKRREEQVRTIREHIDSA